jgi:hypothetical protein
MAMMGRQKKQGNQVPHSKNHMEMRKTDTQIQPPTKLR